MVKNLPVKTGDAGLIPGSEDLLEEEVAIHFSIFLYCSGYRIHLTSERSPVQNREETGLLFGLPGGSDSKVSACNVGDPGSIPGLGRSSGEGNGNPL